MFSLLLECGGLASPGTSRSHEIILLRASDLSWPLEEMFSVVRFLLGLAPTELILRRL